MKPIPAASPAERLAYAREWVHVKQQIAGPSVRFSRPTRRVLVAAMYTILAASPFVFLRYVSIAYPDKPAFLILLGFGILEPLLWTVVSFSVPSSERRKSAELDERERAQRDGARAAAFRVITAIVAVSALYFPFASEFKHGFPMPSSFNEVFALLLPFLWLVITLPTAILAWTLPDPAPEA